MVVSNRRVPETYPDILIGGRTISRVHSYRFLGVILDEKLKFNYHISHIRGKISKLVGILYRIKDEIPLTALKILYHSLVYSRITYCIVVWGSTYDCHLQRLVLIQKKCIRIINRAHYLAHTNNLFLESSILKINDIHRFILGIYMYKEQDNPIFSFSSGYNTRNSNNLYSRFQRLTLTQQSIYFKGPALWNSIPADIRDSRSLGIFKRNYKKFLLAAYEDS